MSNAPTHEELVDLLRLSLIPGVGPRTRKALLEKFGSPKAVLAAAPSELREVQGVGPKLVGKIAGADGHVDAEEEIALCREHGIGILTEAARRLSAVAARDSRPARRALRPRRRSNPTTPWPWASSARGTARSTACARPNGWPAAWRGPAW